MGNIISTLQVLELAFSDGGYIPQDVIAESDIKTATERWVIPVVGRGVMEALLAGEYEQLRKEYVEPVVALYTRILVQPRINAMSGVGGLTVAVGSSHKAAEESLRQEHYKALRLKARSLRRAMSDYLNDNRAQIAEYKSDENILNRCCTDGGLMQIY